MHPDPDFLGLLDLDEIAGDLFVGLSPQKGRTRVYGGQVVAQALEAARRTLDDHAHHVHSLHSYFIRPGDETRPIVYDVDRTRDGRSFSTRTVTARQSGGAIFSMSTSFHRDEPDVEYAVSLTTDNLPSPDDLVADEWDLVSDVRPIPDQAPGRATAWIRLAQPARLPDDRWIHANAVAYSSDSIPMDAIRSGRPGDTDWEQLMGASLDHPSGFMRQRERGRVAPFDMHLQSLRSSRGVAHGTVHTADGLLVATVAQEGLIRLLKARNHGRTTLRTTPSLITEPDDELTACWPTLTNDGTPLNIFGMLGHHPKLLKRFNLLGGFLLNKGVVPAREREIVILRVGANATAEYEFGQHTVIRKACGLTDEEIAVSLEPTTSGQTTTPCSFNGRRTLHRRLCQRPNLCRPQRTLGQPSPDRTRDCGWLLPPGFGVPQHLWRPLEEGTPGWPI
ncbi:MAG: thioesterase family protein [Acidimicrobiales bacterium]